MVRELYEQSAEAQLAEASLVTDAPITDTSIAHTPVTGTPSTDTPVTGTHSTDTPITRGELNKGCDCTHPSSSDLATKTKPWGNSEGTFFVVYLACGSLMFNRCRGVSGLVM